MTGPLIEPWPWERGLPTCERCGHRAVGNSFFVEIDKRLCCPDCQRTVLALRNLDKAVNGNG